MSTPRRSRCCRPDCGAGLLGALPEEAEEERYRSLRTKNSFHSDAATLNSTNCLFEPAQHTVGLAASVMKEGVQNDYAETTGTNNETAVTDQVARTTVCVHGDV